MLVLSQICKICKKELPLSSDYFWVRNDYKTGFYSTCKQCVSNKDNINAQKTQDLKDNKWTCTSCNKTLDLNSKNFYKRNDSFTGYQFRCKSCLRKDPNRYDRLVKKDDLLYFLKDCLNGAKHRSLYKNIEFDLTLEFLQELWNKQNGLCALTKINMTHTILEGKLNTNLSIDKIIPKLGYIKTNVQLVCMCVNRMKSDLSIEELKYFCNLILQNND